MELLSNPAFTQPFTITANLWNTNVWGSAAHKPPNAQPDMYTVYVTQCGGGVSQLWVGGWKTYSIMSNGAGWDDFLWVGPLATATPPQEYDLPLAEGFTEATPCRYWMTQDHEVKTAIRVLFNAVTVGQVCGVMPSGYRPSSLRTVTFSAIFSDATVTQGHADLGPDGSIKLYPYGPITKPGNAILNQFVFVAG